MEKITAWNERGFANGKWWEGGVGGVGMNA